MTEHRHEYTVGVRWIDGHDADGIEHTIPIAYARCTCGYELEYFEIERRLNATEALSAEDAINITHKLLGDPLYATGEEALLEYARILGGEDETE